jgi:hypothetical protein
MICLNIRDWSSRGACSTWHGGGQWFIVDVLRVWFVWTLETDIPDGHVAHDLGVSGKHLMCLKHDLMNMGQWSPKGWHGSSSWHGTSSHIFSGFATCHCGFYMILTLNIDFFVKTMLTSSSLQWMCCVFYVR